MSGEDGDDESSELEKEYEEALERKKSHSKKWKKTQRKTRSIARSLATGSVGRNLRLDLDKYSKEYAIYSERERRAEEMYERLGQVTTAMGTRSPTAKFDMDGGISANVFIPGTEHFGDVPKTMWDALRDKIGAEYDRLHAAVRKVALRWVETMNQINDARDEGVMEDE